jgi:glycosyltransferase involved in cell wall biosynthesis
MHRDESPLGLGRDLDEGAFVLLSVGRLEANKGFDVLARALSSARERLPDRWVWVLVGAGPQQTAIERAIRSLGIHPHVRMAGATTDRELHSLYRRADLFVHPTLYEGSSLVTLEAMAHSKAIVATKVGGIPDKIDSGHSGFLVAPGDAEELAEAIVRAVSRDQSVARKEWGRRARARVEERFSWAVRGREMVALYETVIHEHRHRREGTGRGRG